MPFAGPTSSTRAEFQVPDVIGAQLTRFLETQIIYGDLPPGARLVEEDIVARYNVSRSPVREAFRALEHEGLAVRAMRRGISVSPISRGDLDDVYVCRAVLRLLAVELAAMRRTEAQLAALRTQLAIMEQQQASGDLRGFFECTVRFGSVLYKAAANPVLLRLLENVGRQALRYRFIAYQTTKDMMQVAMARSLEVADAITRRDAGRAKQAMEALMHYSWERGQLALQADRPASGPL